VSITKPLNELTKKTTEWTWGSTQQKAFDTLKHQVTSEPVLAHPVLQDQFELEVDTSGFVVGAVLLQKKKDGKRHPVGYSASLNAMEWNYDNYDLELLAIVKALQHWRPLLMGSPHKIKVFSDHVNLKYWREPQKISRRVAREVLELSEYDLEIHHIKGSVNGQADTLSRRPDYDQGERDNKNITVLPDHMFIRALSTQCTGMPIHPNQILMVQDMTPTNPSDAQDEAIIHPWVDPHKLKKINGIWYKDG
jgi:RNase H-like domain found in reverse transcriptase